MRKFRVSWLALSASGVIAVGACAATGASGPVGAASNDQASILAAHQADRAEMNACLGRIRQAAQAGATGSDITQMRRNCMARANDNAGRIRNQQIAEDPSINGKFTRAFAAAQNAENTGNNEEALRIYKSIDADADEIDAEAARLAPPGRVVSMNTNPAENQNVLNGHALRLQLAVVQEKIGISYERAGRYDEAAAYFQKALNSEGASNGDGMIIGERLAFLYASGLGVPKDKAKARRLFSVRNTERSQTDLALLDHNLLPRTPEEVTPELTQKLNRLIFQEIQSWGEEYRRRWRLEHPGEIYCTVTHYEYSATYARCRNDPF